MDIVFIDGENFRGRIKEVFKKFNKEYPQWDTYDFYGLLNDTIDYQGSVPFRFYRAVPKPHTDAQQQSDTLGKLYRTLGGHLHRQGFKLIRAGVLRADYRKANDPKPTFREKGVDVSMAVDMVAHACDNKLETAYLVASDSDYQPAVAELIKRGKKVVYVGFEVNPNLGLIAKTSDRIIIPNKTVLRYGKNLFSNAA